MPYLLSPSDLVYACLPDGRAMLVDHLGSVLVQV
jgi:hypothetical protein